MTIKRESIINKMFLNEEYSEGQTEFTITYTAFTRVLVVKAKMVGPDVFVYTLPDENETVVGNYDTMIDKVADIFESIINA